MSRGFLLDTNVASEQTHPRSDPHVADWLSSYSNGELFLSVIMLGEVARGIALLAAGKRRLSLEQWLAVRLKPRFEGRVLPVTALIVERWAWLSAQRQQQGRLISMADNLIAATAIEHDLTLVVRNLKDFLNFNLTLLNPWQT